MSLVRCFFTGDFSERDWKNLAGMKVFLFLRVGAEATMPSCELKETFNPDGIGETLYIRVSHRSCDSADEIAETFDAVQIDSNTSSPMWYLCAAPISGLKL